MLVQLCFGYNWGFNVLEENLSRLYSSYKGTKLYCGRACRDTWCIGEPSREGTRSFSCLRVPWWIWLVHDLYVNAVQHTWLNHAFVTVQYHINKNVNQTNANKINSPALYFVIANFFASGVACSVVPSNIKEISFELNKAMQLPPIILLKSLRWLEIWVNMWRHRSFCEKAKDRGSGIWLHVGEGLFSISRPSFRNIFFQSCLRNVLIKQFFWDSECNFVQFRFSFFLEQQKAKFHTTLRAGLTLCAACVFVNF